MGLLDGKIALVTGAAHGIGRGHALELARHGATVIVNDVGGSVSGEGHGTDADAVVKIIIDQGGHAVANYGDVGDEDDTAGMVQQAIDQFGQLDIVINNAGIVRDRAVWNMSPDDFDAVMRVHVRGTWLLSHFAAGHWRERAKSNGGTVSGRIINTTSGAGLWGNFGQTNYATAKAAIAGLTLTLSLELARLGVTVNCIGPTGATRISASVGSWGFTAREPDEIPADEFDAMDPSLSSPLVAWLCSDEAAHVTGQVIRCLGDRIVWMKPWIEHETVTNGGQRWEAETLGPILNAKLFGVRAAGLSV